MDGDLNVLCVLKTEKRSPYNEQYVINLAAGVRRHLPEFHRFICLNDVHAEDVFDMDNGIHWKPMQHKWPRWWAKMNMFSPEMERFGRLWYMDLDTVTAGDLSEMAAYDGPACIVSDWNWGTPSQSVLNFSPGSLRYIWDAWMERPEYWMEMGDRCRKNDAGDQTLFNHVSGPEIDRFQDRYPGQVVSFKKHCRTARGLPEGARIVCFHGRPRPHECDGWIRDIWTSQKP